MTVELRKGHWIVFSALVAIQYFGLWIALTRSPYGPAVRDFYTRVLVGPVIPPWWVIPLWWAIGSAFTTTVILAKLMKVFGK